MSDLPDGWELVELQDLAAPEPRSITDGPFGSNLKTAHYTDDGPRVIRLQNIGDGEFIDERAHIGEEHFAALRAHEAKAGDLIVASLGADLPRACIVPATLGPAIVKADCIRVRLHSAINARFVNYALQRPDLRHAVGDQVHGVGRPRLGMTGIRQLKVPLPPPPEQDRIVEAVEACLDSITRANLQMAHARRLTTRFRRSSVDHVFASLGHGSTASGEEIFTYITSGSRGWAKYYASSGAPFIRIGNVPRDSNNLDLDDVQLVKPPPGAEARRTRVETGDLLVTITADVGRVAVVPDGLGEAYINQHVAIARPRAGINPDYLAWFIGGTHGQRQLGALQRGATKSGLGLDDIRALRIPLPERPVQDEIVDDLREAADRSEALSHELDRLRRRGKALRRAVLAAAFSGQLVPQDSSDESTRELLNRMRAEKSAKRKMTRSKMKVS